MTSPLVAPLHQGPAEAPAVAMGVVRLTRGELRAQVASLRAALQACGVRAGDRVALCLPKSLAAHGLVLAVLDLGAAYVPLDHRLSPARLARILDDLAPRLVVAPEGAVVPPGLALAHPDGLAGLRLATPGGAAEAIASPAGLAAILFTSGSTGEPKGIMLSHDNIGVFRDWALGALGLGPQDAIAGLAPFHFDLSTLDIFGTLAAGACLTLVGEDAVAFPGAVRAVLAGQAITTLYATPSALTRLQARGGLRDLPALRRVLFAGESFPPAALRRVMCDLPQAQFKNLYGPTETNVCTWHPVAPGDAEPPIGRPLPWAEVTLRDPAGAEVPPGETGEICVAGPGVMLGYWRRPEATAATRLHGRADSYRTGDLGTLGSDGAIRFLGRRDHQVKLRGHRIELAAVEATLLAHPALREAACLLLPDEAGGRLLACVAGTAEPAALRALVAERLSPQAAPDAFLFLPEFPLTPSGKIDRAALAARARERTPCRA
jgi:amino acid adenylation domain-containing protein